MQLLPLFRGMSSGQLSPLLGPATWSDERERNHVSCGCLHCSEPRPTSPGPQRYAVWFYPRPGFSEMVRSEIRTGETACICNLVSCCKERIRRTQEFSQAHSFSKSEPSPSSFAWDILPLISSLDVSLWLRLVITVYFHF